MSEFSEACRRLIEVSDTNVYQIAKRSGLDRTTLQKMVQGNRLPSQRFVEEFCEYLLINNSEKDELLRLFQMEKIGREKYFCRREVENFLCNFGNLKDSLENGGYRRSIRIDRIDDGNGKPPVVRRLSMDVDVISAIQYVILHACDTDGEIPIYMDTFPYAEYAMQQILQEKDNPDKRIACCQFVDFYHKNGSSNGLQKNVQNLHMILSFAFACPEGYEIRYFYKTIEEPDPCRIWPHYIVTEKNVLLLEEEGHSGILMEDEKIAAEYLTRLRGMRKKGKNLLAFTGSAGQMLETYGRSIGSGKMLISFDTMLCMGDILPKLVTPEKAAESSLIRSYMQLIGRRDEENFFEDGYRRISCMNGIEDFVRTGRLPGIYGEFLDPVSAEKRGEVLMDYCRSMEERQNEFILKEEIPIPADGLNFELYEPDRVVIYSIRKELSFGCVCIEEPGAYQVFRDYFETLAEEGKAYDAQESCRVLKRTCRNLIKKYNTGEVKNGMDG